MIKLRWKKPQVNDIRIIKKLSCIVEDKIENIKTIIFLLIMFLFSITSIYFLFFIF